ncbi:unnamed protein product, partial [marine sediment metagenome]
QASNDCHRSFGKDIGLKPPRFQADIVTVSHSHYDHNNVSSLKGDPFVVNDSGEYELKGITIRGINSFHDQKQGEERGLNTIFTIEAEDIRICHLGDLGQKELIGEQLEKLGEIDILIIPVGGIYTIDAEKAANIINQIEPRIVIPMHYKVPKLKIKLKELNDFLKEMGTKEEVVEQLTVKKRDLFKEEMKIVVMKTV